MPSVSVVVLAYGSEPYLVPCVEHLLESRHVDVEVVLVDNGCTDDAIARIVEAGDDRVKVVTPRENLGYAGGCNEGVRHSTGEFVAFVNYDALVDGDAVAELCRVAGQPEVGIATASIRLADEPELLNSAGNDIHFTGISWSGRYREPAAAHVTEEEVAGASGAGMVLRRDVWDRLGGFDPAFFMYHDDAELSLRCHLLGLQIVYVPSARVLHRYEFTRNPDKLYLIERNRLIMVLTAYSPRTLLLVFPALVLVEVAMFALSLREGWWRAKFAGWAWLLRNTTYLRERRARVQRARVVPDKCLVRWLIARIEPGNYDVSPSVRVLNSLLVGYWRAIDGLV